MLFLWRSFCRIRNESALIHNFLRNGRVRGLTDRAREALWSALLCAKSSWLLKVRFFIPVFLRLRRFLVTAKTRKLTFLSEVSRRARAEDFNWYKIRSFKISSSRLESPVDSKIKFSKVEVKVIVWIIASFKSFWK